MSKASIRERSQDKQRKKYANFCLELFNLVAESQMKLKSKMSNRTPPTYDVLHDVVIHTLKGVNLEADLSDFDFALRIPCSSGTALEIRLKWKECKER